MTAFWTESYRAHFQHFFQKPFDIQTYRDDKGFALKVATHDWAVRGYRVYASMGLADKLAANDEDEFGEVILFSDVSDKEVPALFVKALFSFCTGIFRSVRASPSAASIKCSPILPTVIEKPLCTSHWPRMKKTA